MDYLNKLKGFKTYNLGICVGFSVLEMVHAFGKALGVAIPYQILPRRDGDLSAFWVDANLARQELGWEVSPSIDGIMCNIETGRRTIHRGTAVKTKQVIHFEIY